METSVNNKCKAFTSLEQSRKLAEILPLETADMRYAPFGDTHPWFCDCHLLEKGAIPCWSLAALITILPVSCDDGQHCFALINCNPNDATEWLCCYEDCKGDLLNECYADNSIDACVDLILKLHELKLL